MQVTSLAGSLPRVPPVSLPERLERACAPAVDAARAGCLTTIAARKLAAGEALAADRELAALPKESLLPLLRHVFASSASWALFHDEWMDSLFALVTIIGRTQCVLEVCAGSGSLIEPMRARGLEWSAYDAKPPRGAHADVVACSAIEAVRCLAAPSSAEGSLRELQDQPPEAPPPYQTPPDQMPAVVFWSWWSKSSPKKKHKAERRADEHLGADAAVECAAVEGAAAEGAAAEGAAMPEDVLVMRECVRGRHVVIFVGEPRGGLTGSSELWDDLPDGCPEDGWSILPAAEVLEAFVDVVQWPGFSDRTWVAVPSARKNPH